MNEISSNCCGAKLIDPSGLNKEGFCSDCKEHAAGVVSIFINHIKSFYPLGTTDGSSWTVVPRA